MVDPYVSLEMHDGMAVIKVAVGKNALRFPLTKAGCLAAGRDIFKMDAPHFMCSSSVDFPQLIKPRCRLDVRELMSEGFTKAMDEAERPRKKLISKIVTFCNMSAVFMSKLTDEEKALFDVLYSTNHIGDRS